MLRRNFSIFASSGETPAVVIIFPKNFILYLPISHFPGDSFKPDFLTHSKMFGISSSNECTPLPLSSMNCVFISAAKHGSR